MKRLEAVCKTTPATMTRKDYLIAKRLKERLAGVVQLVDFKVFGSRTRGDNVKESDIDVFIEVEYIDKLTKKKILDIVWEVGYDNSIFISPLIFTRYEIEQTPLRSSPIVKNIDEEGVRL